MIEHDDNKGGSLGGSSQAALRTGRRAFLRNVGVGTAGAAALGAGAVMPTSASAAANATDLAVLNFALNLEYLEAEYYLRAATGQGLSAADTSGPTAVGPVSGGRQVSFVSAAVKNYAMEIAGDEKKHVEALRATIKAFGGTPVSEPAINIGSSFTTLAVAAGLISQGQTFDPYANDTNFLLGAYIFEDVGVTAYHGAAGLITDKTILGAAAGILAVEAYHAGLVRTFLYAQGLADGGHLLFRQTALISALRAQLSGAQDDQGISQVATESNIVPTDANGIAFARNTRQVLNIVYGKVGAASGLFFPNGMNGAITK